MHAREGNPLRIRVIAASPGRRSAIAAVVREAHTSAVISNGSSLEHVFAAAIDLIVVDVDSPAVASAVVRAARALPERPGWIALADNPDSDWVSAALRAGVNAILPQDATREEMRLAMLAAEAGFVLLHPSSVPTASRGEPGLSQRYFIPDHDSADLVEDLTVREREVLRLASEGLGNKEIALRLNISDHTVKFHISSILSKLGVASRTEAVSQGIRRGLIAI